MNMRPIGSSGTRCELQFPAPNPYSHYYRLNYLNVTFDITDRGSYTRDRDFKTETKHFLPEDYLGLRRLQKHLNLPEPTPATTIEPTEPEAEPVESLVLNILSPNSTNDDAGFILSADENDVVANETMVGVNIEVKKNFQSHQTGKVQEGLNATNDTTAFFETPFTIELTVNMTEAVQEDVFATNDTMTTFETSSPIEIFVNTTEPVSFTPEPTTTVTGNSSILTFD